MNKTKTPVRVGPEQIKANVRRWRRDQGLPEELFVNQPRILKLKNRKLINHPTSGECGVKS